MLYLAGTRPDNAYAVNVLSRHQINPMEQEYNTLERVFRYLKGTKMIGLKYLAKSDDLVVFTDLSYVDCEDMTSSCGYVIRIFKDTIAW